MVTVIAEILRQKIASLEWVERVGGLVQVAERPIYSTAANLSQTVTGRQAYPVACTVNSADCWENGVYKLLEPDSTKSSVVYFMDRGGVQCLGAEGPKKGAVRYRFDIDMFCWLNLARLGEPITANGCTVSGRIVPYFIEKLMGEHTATGLFDGALEEDAFLGVTVLKIDEMRKSPDIFAPFDFQKRTELFFTPYDYFGLKISGEFVIPTSCLPVFGEGWVPAEGCFIYEGGPGTPGVSYTLCDRIFKCLADLEEFDTPEAGQAGGLLIDGYRFFVMGEGTDSIPYGTIMRLPDL